MFFRTFQILCAMNGWGVFDFLQGLADTGIRRIHVSGIRRRIRVWIQKSLKTDTDTDAKKFKNGYGYGYKKIENRIRIQKIKF